MTWAGKRRTHLVESWIDRAMANDQWKATFPASEVEYLEMIESDHIPAIIKIRRTTEQGFRPFQFDTRLCKIADFEDVVQKRWNKFEEDYHESVYGRIKCCRRDISEWKRNHCTNSAVRICELSHAIDMAHSDNHTTMDQIYGLRRELLQAYRDEETFWRLKRRVQWLNEGDRNTRFFHAVTKNRVARNRLTSILNTNGEEIRGNTAIAEEAISYFKDLFSSTACNPSNALHNIKLSVTEAMNATLLQDISEEEIKKAMFSIGASRAPGPDGFNAAFYQ